MSTDTATVIGPYKVGEIPAPVVVTFKDSAGAVLNISGYTPKWTIKREFDASVTKSASLVTDGTDGKVIYTWVDGDMSLPGEWIAEAWVGNGSNRFATVTFAYRVDEAVADSTPSI